MIHPTPSRSFHNKGSAHTVLAMFKSEDLMAEGYPRPAPPLPSPCRERTPRSMLVVFAPMRLHCQTRYCLARDQTS